MIGERRKNSFCTRLILMLCLTWVVESQAALYPSGTGNGDTALSKQNDFALRMTLDRAFPFGGKYHSTLYISDNGVISFDDAVSEESDLARNRMIPYYYDVDGDGRIEDPDTIFAFWADVDITGDGGNVYYRVTSSTATLDQATADVRSYFRSNADFRAQVVIVVTWDQVSFFDQDGASDPRNTFQAVLIHDGQESFVLLNYGSITWVVGTRMDGDPNTGLYFDTKIGIAIVGFLMGDGDIVKNFAYEQDTLQTLSTDSNVDVNGVYAYKVDGSSVIDPVCKTAPGAELSITPARCGMMGGEKIYLYGPCWAVEAVQTCVFSYGGEIIQQVNATIINTNEAYCVPDPFFLVGEVTVTVVEAGDELANSPSTIYSVIESGRITPTVTRRNSDTSSWDKAGNSLQITWDVDQESFGPSDSALSITVLAYREDNPGPRWENVYMITNGTADDGSYTFTPTAQVDVTETNAFGVIRITGMDNGRQRALWSDIHPLGYLLEQSYQDDSVMWASEKCNDWITADNAKGAFLNNLPACPCTLDQAEQDVGTFITDPSCYPDGGEDTCAEHEGAIHCLLSAYASPNTMSGTKCCYDANRLLMHSGDTMYAGMAGRSHIRGSSPYMARNLVSELSHWSNDVIAKHFCCEWAGEKECFDYITLRPTTDCAAYEPPNHALSFGDPHFITMDRYNYTFNGLGEFTLLRYATSGTKTGASDFELQGRQTKTMDRNGREVDVTQLSSVAMKDSGSDSIFVEASATSGMDVYRRSMDEGGEWQSVYFAQQTFTDLQGCAVAVTRFERDVEIYGVVVMFKETCIGVHVTYDYGMLAVRPILPSTLNSDHLSGLLGNMDGDPSNDIVRRDNNNPLDDPTDEEIFQFGQTWEIETDYSLFRYVSGRHHSDYHDASFVPLMNVILPTLYPACNEVSQCLFDYEVSNDDTELAMATLGVFEAFESSSENIRKIDACPYQITPYNGTKTYTSDTNRYFEDAEVSFICDEGLIMVGSSYKRCAYSAEEGSLMWTGSTDDNECIESSCGFLDTPSNGSISLSEDGLTATFACQEGFTMNGANQSVCRDAVWSSGAPTCTAASTATPTTGTDDPIADPTGAARTELPTTGITLTCNDTQMIVEIPKSLLTGGMEGSNVGFNDDTNGQQCVGEEDGPIIKLTTNLNACGTVMTEDDETETYTNHVSNRYDDDSGISRQYAVEIPLSCSYNRSQRVGSMKYQLTDYTIDKTLVEEGAYTFSFDIYTDNTYTKVDDTYPISIGLNKDLVFAASVDSLDGTLDLSIQSCRATPDSKYDSDPHFEFIAEGCSIDDDNTKITTLEDHRIGVEMKTIRFIDDEDDWIYIHCNLLVCDDEDDDSVCNNDCALGSSEIMGRKRRDVSSELKTKRFTRGPLRVVRSAQRQGSVLRKDVSENGASTQQEVTNAFNPWIVAMAAMATGFMAMAATMAVVLRKFSKISAAPTGYKEASARLLDEQEEI